MRFVNTHLEEKHSDTPAAPVQAAQAAELLQGPAGHHPAGSCPLVVGDTNSSPVDPLIFGIIPTPTMQFWRAGYRDAWTLRPGKVPWVIGCPIGGSLEPQLVLSERVDMLFSLMTHDGETGAGGGANRSRLDAPPGRGLWPSGSRRGDRRAQFPENDALPCPNKGSRADNGATGSPPVGWGCGVSGLGGTGRQACREHALGDSHNDALDPHPQGSVVGADGEEVAHHGDGSGFGPGLHAWSVARAVPGPRAARGQAGELQAALV